MQEKFTNSLITASSPYLLQHAHNPVHWHPWKKEVLQKAQKADKLLLVSIGYAACHWCHVMEKESFKDEEVAAVMNEHFINIKVDREERPDIDHIYMNAVQLMTGGGGWPLNVVALPDGRPVWGGTYFKKEQWISILQQLAELHNTRPAQLLEYAKRLQEGLQYSFPVISISEKNRISPEDIEKAVSRWSAYFDTEYGGHKRAPKFMMPVQLGFLLHYAVRCNDKRILTHVEITLTKMAYGGIYDQLGGGFSRYSVDEKWHIPHFEKMLYDNAQLVSVYSDAYRLTKNDLYREVVENTLDFVARELTHTRGAFFSSLDADSLNEAGEIEEGAFYVWKKSELQRLLKDNFPLFAQYYNINDVGYWEDEKYVLIRTVSEDEIAAAHRCTAEEVKTEIDRCNRILFEARERRSKPGLDDKTLTSWNALMLQGYVAAYKAFDEKEFLHKAIKNAGFLMEQQTTGDGGLYHSFKAGKSTVNGFLEDYAAACEAFIALYEVSGEEKWLLQARQWVDYCYDYFYDEKSGFFFFTSHTEEVVVTRTIETDDNVIPASNSILAKVLFKLSRYVENNRYAETAEQMLLQLKNKFLAHPYSYANWLELALYLSSDFYEVAISGKQAKDLVKEFSCHYLPNIVIAAGETASALPLLKDRYVPGETLIYVCKDKSCQLPVHTVEEALEQMGGVRKSEK